MKIQALFDVAEKIVLLTGGLGQLGRQFGRTFLDNGARLAVLDVHCDAARLAEVYGDAYDPARVCGVSADVTRRDSLEAALAEVAGQFGQPPHVLINNAALDSPPGSPAAENGPFETYPEASWDQVIDVNLKGSFLCAQVFGGAMARAGRGSIISIASIYGLVSPDQRIYEYRQREGGEPFFKPVAYAASKSGLFNLTRYLATYWAGRGVRVNSLTFAGVFNHQDPEFLRGYCPKVPLGRMARADEYNGAVIFLASEASSYMTGANLVLDGGYTAW